MNKLKIHKLVIALLVVITCFSSVSTKVSAYTKSISTSGWVSSVMITGNGTNKPASFFENEIKNSSFSARFGYDTSSRSLASPYPSSTSTRNGSVSVTNAVSYYNDYDGLFDVLVSYDYYLYYGWERVTARIDVLYTVQP